MSSLLSEFSDGSHPLRSCTCRQPYISPHLSRSSSTSCVFSVFRKLAKVYSVGLLTELLVHHLSLPSFPRRIGPNYYQDFTSFHLFSLFFLHMSEVKPLDLIAGYHPGLWECVGGESERERKRGREGAKENGGGNRMTPVHTRNEERIVRAALQEPVDTVYHGPSN